MSIVDTMRLMQSSVSCNTAVQRQQVRDTQVLHFAIELASLKLPVILKVSPGSQAESLSRPNLDLSQDLFATMQRETKQ